MTVKPEQNELDPAALTAPTAAMVKQLEAEKRDLQVARNRALFIDQDSGLLNRRGLAQALKMRAPLDPAGGSTLALISVQLSREQLHNLSADPATHHHVMNQLSQRLGRLCGGELIGAWSDSLLVGITGGFDWAALTDEHHVRLDAIEHALTDSIDVRGVRMRPQLRIGLARPGLDGLLPGQWVSHAQSVALNLAQQQLPLTEALKDSLHATAKRRKLIETGLARALEQNELTLMFQPVQDCATGSICSVEALVRWSHPDLGLIYPVEFVNTAEDSGLTEALGQWVLQHSLSALRSLHEAGFALRCSVNCSPRQFDNPLFAEHCLSSLSVAGLRAGWLEVEVTESSALGNAAATILSLQRLREAGCSVAMDDFGTGYATLNYLKNLPMDVLKVDRSFVTDIAHNPHSQKIVQAIIDLAHALGLTVQAEGVESTEQMDALLAMGCDRIQGYLLSRPLPLQALLDWLADQPMRKA